jgi:hypothetical protein
MDTLKAFVRRVRTTAVAILATSLACHDATAPAPSPCVGSIEVGVLTTTQPTFTWSPQCGISALTVTTVSAIPEEEVMWGFTVSEQAPLGPAIVYGTNPRGANVWTQPKHLSVGKTYRITVTYTVGGDALVASGATTFTWFPPD